MPHDKAAAAVRYHRLLPDGAGAVEEALMAVEAPIAIRLGALPFAVMMASPTDLHDFAYGFCLTEGLIAAEDDIRAVSVGHEGDGFGLDITLAPDKLSDHLKRKRSLSGRSSCGLCGIEDMAMLAGSAPARVEQRPIAAAAIFRALELVDAAQNLNARTRATHAAGFMAHDGALRFIREDVGRHNALDKVIGAAMQAGLCGEDGFLVVTSRASFEMVEKAARFGAATLVAISAPTSLAVKKAESYGLTLVAIARPDGARLYTGTLASPI